MATILARTRRLILREVVDADAEPLGRCFADPETMAFYPDVADRKTTREWIAAQQASYAARGYGLWAACERTTGDFLGYCGLAAALVFEESGEPEEIEVGYLIRRDLWNRGLGTEAARAAVRLCRRRFGRPDPVALVDPGNAASIRVAEKIGMRLEGETVKWGRTLRVYRAVGAAATSLSPSRGRGLV